MDSSYSCLREKVIDWKAVLKEKMDKMTAEEYRLYLPFEGEEPDQSLLGCPECGHPWSAHYHADGSPRLCVLAVGGGPGHACSCRAGFLYGEDEDMPHNA